MHLDFLHDYFSNYETLNYETMCGNKLETEWLYIKNPDYSEPIKVYYEPNDHEPYMICFATQHLHIADKKELVEAISKFANGSIAAIEFYHNGKNCFGGQIETEHLSNITYDSLREYFRYPKNDLSNLTFRIYAWNKSFCYEGSFIKRTSGQIDIVKKY